MKRSSFATLALFHLFAVYTYCSTVYRHFFKKNPSLAPTTLSARRALVLRRQRNGRSVRTVLVRVWQKSTVEFEFLLPLRFLFFGNKITVQILRNNLGSLV